MSSRSQAQCNRICEAAWNDKSLSSHTARLAAIKPSIDNKPPVSYKIHLNRSKKVQLHIEEFNRIDRENALLLKKMTAIIRKPHQSREYYQENNYTHSLNANIRKQQLKLIIQQNQQILHRIERRKGFYNSADWLQHESNHLSYLEQLKEKPISPRLVRQLNHHKPQQSPHLPAINPKHKSDNKVQLTQEGRLVSNKYVILTIHHDQQNNCFTVESYDMDSAVHTSITITAHDIRQMPEYLNNNKIFDPNQHNKLAEMLLYKLQFDENNELRFVADQVDSAAKRSKE
jgi:hypothetical protein